jgi:hypothetical protein
MPCKPTGKARLYCTSIIPRTYVHANKREVEFQLQMQVHPYFLTNWGQHEYKAMPGLFNNNNMHKTLAWHVASAVVSYTYTRRAQVLAGPGADRTAPHKHTMAAEEPPHMPGCKQTPACTHTTPAPTGLGSVT